MRKLILGILLGFCVVLIMGSITVTTLIPHLGSDIGRTHWTVNATSADVSGTEELKAAPSSGALYIKQLVINVDADSADITVTIGGSENSGAVRNIILGPITFDVNGGGNYYFTPMRPIKLADANSLTIDASAAEVVHVFVEGFTK